MTRSCYSDEFGDDFPGQMELFRANVERSLRSKDGQARLRELRDALLALPVKVLEQDTFVEEGPRVCALGAWALAKAGGDAVRAQDMVSPDADDLKTALALKSYHWPRLAVLETIYINDGGWETPEKRYTRVLAWVESNLQPERA